MPVFTVGQRVAVKGYRYLGQVFPNTAGTVTQVSPDGAIVTVQLDMTRDLWKHSPVRFYAHTSTEINPRTTGVGYALTAST